MDIDLDDLISTDATKTAKAGIKFQPKGKPKPKPKPKPNAQLEPKSALTPPTDSVEIAPTTEELTGNDANQVIGNVLGSLQSFFEKPHEESDESFVTLDSPNDLLPESTTTTVNLPPCSETPTVDVSMDGKLEAGPTVPELINNIDASTNLESIAELDPLTGKEAAILNDNENFQIGNLSPGSKEDSFSWDTVLAQSITRLGQGASKFKPKPKAQSRKMEQITNNPDQTGLMENEPGPSFNPDEILGTCSVSTETTSQVDSVNEAGRSSDKLTRLANKALQLIDDDYVPENDNDYNNYDDCVLENESLTVRKGSKRKSKKPLDENKKPVRKRKKVTEVVGEVTEVPKKKFSHSTKRNKRQVNPELLKIPEDEFELHMHNFPLKELIRLREHKERIEKKEASLATDTTDKSDQAQNATYYNYGTHMKTTQRMKWTKLDTEQFYEAIQQFGTDLSIIKECFPGRTREQIRSKFKKEYKQNRFRIDSALNTRSKGHSHFEYVIERLKQAHAEDSENDDPVTLGEDDEVVATDINDGDGDDVGLQKEVKDVEPEPKPDILPAGAESPAEFNDIEDDIWSQYKSEL